MATQRKSIDCRDYPSEKNCSLRISGTEEEVLDAAVQHAVSAHGHQNTPELREQIKSMLKNETYTGTRYYSRITPATEANREGKQVIRGKWVYRDRAEWIAVPLTWAVQILMLDHAGGQDRARRP